MIIRWPRQPPLSRHGAHAFPYWSDAIQTASIALDEGTASVRTLGFSETEMLLHRGQRSGIGRGEPPDVPERFHGSADREGVRPAQGQGSIKGTPPHCTANAGMAMEICFQAVAMAQFQLAFKLQYRFRRQQQKSLEKRALK